MLVFFFWGGGGLGGGGEGSSFFLTGVPQGFRMEPLFFWVFSINHRGSAGNSPGIFLKYSVSEPG